MFEHLSSKKKVWFAACLIMLALPVFLPSTPGSDVVGMCSFLLLAAAYPLNMLFLPFYYLLDYYLGVERTSLGHLYFLIVANSIIGYLQWFYLFPYLLGLFREKYIAYEMHSILGKPSFNSAKLLEERFEIPASWFDEQHRSPFERVMRQKNED